MSVSLYQSASAITNFVSRSVALLDLGVQVMLLATLVREYPAPYERLILQLVLISRARPIIIRPLLHELCLVLGRVLNHC
jgi:hypothetical protein